MPYEGVNRDNYRFWRLGQSIHWVGSNLFNTFFLRRKTMDFKKSKLKLRL